MINEFNTRKELDLILVMIKEHWLHFQMLNKYLLIQK